MSDLKSIYDWYNENFDEKQMRTCLGAGQPPQAGSGNYPASYFAPISASAIWQLEKFHSKEHPELKHRTPAKKKPSKKKSDKKKK